MIVNTLGYTREEIGHIVSVRAKTEGLELSPKAIESMAKIGEETSLRYVMQLLTPAAIAAEMNGRVVIEQEDVESMYDTFLDFRRSTKQLKAHSDKYLQ